MKYLIVDFSAVFCGAKYSLGTTDPSEENMDQIVYRFFKTILSISKKVGTNKLLWCFDSKKSIRKSYYPEYKGGRKKDKTEDDIIFDKSCYELADQIRDEILPSIGFKNIYLQDFYEADDLCAKLIEQDSSTFHDFVCMTSDEDYFQLLKNDNLRELYLVGKTKFYRKSDFIRDYDIDPNKWHLIKAIGGCKSDYVVGVQGVAEKTAIKFLKGEMKTDSKKYQDIVTFKHKGRNKALVTLPHKGTKEMEIVDDSLSMEEFTKFCMEYGFESFLNEMFEDWSDFLGGKKDISNELKDRAKERRRK
jgi:DNA polymerase-1